jgi:hypothetical protein
MLLAWLLVQYKVISVEKIASFPFCEQKPEIAAYFFAFISLSQKKDETLDKICRFYGRLQIYGGLFGIARL